MGRTSRANSTIRVVPGEGRQIAFAMWPRSTRMVWPVRGTRVVARDEDNDLGDLRRRTETAERVAFGHSWNVSAPMKLDDVVARHVARCDAVDRTLAEPHSAARAIRSRPSGSHGRVRS